MSEQRYFTFRKLPDWKRGWSGQLNMTHEGLSIVRQDVYRLAGSESLSHPAMSRPILDAAVDQHGRWFLLDASGVIWRTDLTSLHAEPLNLPVQDQLDHRARIAVYHNTLIVLQPGVEDVLTALTLDQAQIKWTNSSWHGVRFEPIDIAVQPNGCWIVLAAFQDAENPSRILKLLRFETGGKEKELVDIPIQLADDPLTDRFDLTVHADEGWLLDRKDQTIIHIRLHEFTAALHPQFQVPGLGTAISSDRQEAVWVLSETVEEPHSYFLLCIDRNGRITERAFPGNARGKRLHVNNRQAYIMDVDELNVYTLRPVSETAIWQPLSRRIGVWMSNALDSGAPETDWHKVILRAEQHNDTQINLRYYASDTKEIVIDGERLDLDLYTSNDQIPPETKHQALSKLWRKPLTNPQDALLDAKGRYLWIYIELIGSERHSPVLHSLEIYFPRSSYLEYLPGIYQQHEPSANFLARYLSIFQTLLEETDQRILDVTRTFDANSVTGASLKWLVGWLGIQAEDHWTEEQLKQLLKHAPVLYSMRGTKYAMELIISIYTGEKPIILEYDQIKPLKENPELIEVADKLYAAEHNVFNVLVKPEHADTEIKRVTLEQMIEAFKPVFAVHKLVILQPWVYMDLHSYLGLNTVLSEPALLRLDGRSSMPHHTITIDVGPNHGVDQHTRLEIDSRLE